MDWEVGKGFAILNSCRPTLGRSGSHPQASQSLALLVSSQESALFPGLGTRHLGERETERERTRLGVPMGPGVLVCLGFL